MGSLQRSGLGWLYGVYHGAHNASCRGSVLGDGMGMAMGKTVQVLTIIHTLLTAQQVYATAPGLALGRSFLTLTRVVQTTPRRTRN